MPPDTDPITSEEEFRTRLAALLTEAIRNDVAVERGWTCRDVSEPYDYEAVITAVDKSS